MVSRATARFWRAYAALPADVRRQARAAYRLFAVDPRHPGLRFKQVHPSAPVVSVRVGLEPFSAGQARSAVAAGRG